MSKETFRLVFALTVLFVWAIVTLSSLITQEYTSLGVIQPVMLIVAGFIFGHRGGSGR